MPSPALAKLEQLPKTPLSSNPGSPNRSQPNSRRGSSSASSMRRPSMAAAGVSGPSGLATGAGAAGIVPSSSSSNASGNASGSSSGTNLHALTSISNNAQQQQQQGQGQVQMQRGISTSSATSSGEKEIAQAVKEEDMGMPSSTTTTPHHDSAIADDSSSSSSSEGEGEEVEYTRTGHPKLRQGSRRLSRMSSTLGEGATAHWRRPSSSSAASQNNNPPVAPSPLSQNPVVNAPKSSPSPPRPASLPASITALSPSSRAGASSLPGAKKDRKVELSPIEHAKRSAARRAVDAHVKDHHRVIGVGSGSTVPYVVERILEMGEEVNRRRWFVPTGFQSKELIVNAGLKLGDVDQFPKIDVTIDGADDVDLALNAIKGGGACHFREKVLAEAADEFVIVADYRKNNILLGDGWKQGIPIETPPFAYSKVLDNLRRIPGCVEPVLRMGKAKAGPCVTDNGNFVIDAIFDEAHMREPDLLLSKIKMLTGVVECGLFIGMARAAYFGNEDGTVTVRWSDGQTEILKEGQEAGIRREHVDEEKSLKAELLTVDLEYEDVHGEEEGKTDAQKVDTNVGRDVLSRKLEELKMTST